MVPIGLVLTLLAGVLGLLAAVPGGVKMDGVFAATGIGRHSTEAFAIAAREALGSAKIRVGTFTEYASEEDRFRATGEAMTDCTLKTWRASIRAKGYEGEQFQCPTVRQAIKIGTGIVMRTVMRDCTSTSRVIAGTENPLALRIDGEDIQILDVIITERPSTGPARKISVTIFAAMRGRISLMLAKALLLKISKTTGVRELTVRLRNDSWFVTDCEFPPVYLFSGVRPTVPRFAAGDEATCVALRRWPIRCF